MKRSCSDDELHLLYCIDGLNARQLGELYSVTHRAVLLWLAAAGITRRSPRTRPRPSKVLVDGSAAQIVLCHRDGSLAGHALIDAADLPLVSSRRWCLVNGYVVSRRPTTLLLHRVLLDAPPELMVDHIDGDGLNNRRCNLRLASSSQNAQNRCGVRSARKLPGARGVYPQKGRWVAKARVGGRLVHVGMFASHDEAEAAAIAFRREHMPFSSMDQ